MDKNLLPFPENRFQAKYFFWNLVKKEKIRKALFQIKAPKKGSFVEEDLDLLDFYPPSNNSLSDWLIKK